MKITKRQLRRIIRESMSERVGGGNLHNLQAHPRGDLGKNIADVDFPIMVGYDLNGLTQSEVAYSQDELDEILDYLAPLGGGKGVPYSLDSLSDMEPQDQPIGAEIDYYTEGAASTEKYDDDSALRGKQSELPDALQKGIIDKTVEDREEKDEEKDSAKNEGTSLKDMPESWRQILGDSIISERGTGNPRLASSERNLINAVVEWVDQYRLVMGFDPNDYGDDKRVKRTLHDILGTVLGEL